VSRKVHLNVLLPKDRNHVGRIRVEVDGKPQAEFHVLGRGSTKVKGTPTGNATRSPFGYAGDTPTGTYTSSGILGTKGQDQKSYGPWGKIPINASGGDALLAQEVFGRSHLLIHGGAPGKFDGYNPTLGCLRLTDKDMKQLIDLITTAGNVAESARCENVSIRVTVQE